MDNKQAISNFLQKQPLYFKVEIDKHYFHPTKLVGLTFPFFCPNESSIQTFMLTLEPEKGIKTLGSLSFDKFDDLFDPYQEDKSIKFTHHFAGQCQYCKKYKVDFLLNVFSDGPIPGLTLYRTLPMPVGRGGGMPSVDEKIPLHKLYIRKIGQFPPFEINPDKEVLNFIKEDDRDFYKKALICLSQSFGIGAYAYLRRITENEILRIVESLGEIQTVDGEKIRNLYEQYKSNRQMSSLIEGVYNHLPSGLKSLGTNPLKILYSHLSEGIHSDSEETCLKKAFGLDVVLRFTIKKLNEEKHELKEIRSVLKDLGH